MIRVLETVRSRKTKRRTEGERKLGFEARETKRTEGEGKLGF